MSPCMDADCLTEVERVREVAAILARGVLRLRARMHLPDADSGQKPLKLGENGLDSSPTSRPDGRSEGGLQPENGGHAWD